MDKGTDEKLEELVQRSEDFKKFEETIKSEFGIAYSPSKYPSFFDYVSSLLMVDMLDKFFNKAGIILPSKANLLDVGAGKWGYVHSLYAFLKNYGGERSVHLTGIDLKGEEYREELQPFIEDFPVDYIPGNLFDLNSNDKFDFVFMAHMLTSPQHFEKFNLDPAYYRPSSELFGKVFELLRKGGLFIGIANYFGGEMSIFNDFPENKKFFDRFYVKDLGSVTDFLSNYYNKFNETGVMLGKN